MYYYDNPESVSLYQLKKTAPGYAPYKNERFIDIQNKAIEMGVAEWKFKYMVSWFFVENGTLSEWREGDYGPEIGLTQCHPVHRDCMPLGDYEGQKEQSINWFIEYTHNSNENTIIRDIRKGHNPNATNYEWKIKDHLKFFTITGQF